MARKAGATSRVYVDEFDVSGLSNELDLSIDVELPEVTAFSDAAKTFVEGKYGHRATVNGFIDLDDDAWDEQAFTIIGEDALHTVGLYPGSDAGQGEVGYEVQSRPARQPRPVNVAGAVLLNMEWQGDKPVVRSTVLASEAVTGTGDISGSNIQTGASSAGEVFVAILRVLSVSGTGSITVKLQESQDDGSGDSYADLITFSAATAVGVERKTTSSATEAWKKVNVSAFSGFTSVTIMVVVGTEQAS
jgi:hypothetical protein